MLASAAQPAGIAELLDRSPADQLLALPASLWGFGGVHGGLALGMLLGRMVEAAGGAVPHRVHAEFRGALRAAFRLQVRVERRGRMLAWVTGEATDGAGTIRLHASAVFAHAAHGAAPAAYQPQAPPAPPPEACPVLTPPAGVVPFAQHVELRPATDARPFCGGSDPTLMAWVRLRDDSAPLDAARLAFLLDALAPAHSAVLHAPAAIPTVTYALTLTGADPGTDSRYVLLRSTTSAQAGGGFLEERIDAWSTAGVHLAAAQQFRVQLPL